MRSFPTPGPGGAGRLGRRLLLTLALCACGGGDEAGAGGAGGAEGASAEAAPAASATLASNSNCPTTLPAFSRELLAGPWQTVLDSLAAAGVTFPDTTGNDTIGLVALCRNCTRVRVEIRASSITPCLQPGNLHGPNRRIAGMFILHDPFPAQKGWDSLSAGDTILVFAHLRAGAGTLIYNMNGTATRAPHTSWQFWYCEHDTTSGPNPSSAPQAQWRSRSGSTSSPGGAQVQQDEGGDGGNYGWMACASGCCQFYTPPPNEIIIETPIEANVNAPDTVGRNHRKPTWCHGT